MNSLQNFSSRKLFTALFFALRTIRTHSARTALALLGVVIGVFAVVFVSVLGEAVRGFVIGQVDNFGTDLIQIEVKVPSTGKMSSDNAFSRAQGTEITTLSVDDRDALRRLPSVKAAYAGSIGQERAVVGSTGKRILLFGTGAEAPLVDGNIKLASGRFFTEDEDRNAERVVVIGSEIKTAFFGGRPAVGEHITLKGEKYRVVGVLAERGAAGFIDLDTFTYVPIRTLQRKILGVDYVQMISVKMRFPERERETVADIMTLLRKRHDIDDPKKDDFSVTSTKEAQETLSAVLDSLSILLLALTSISLIVGGVGIMNVMYVSVAERTAEIGLRKAVGATSGSILRQFLFEALIITGLGGFLGVLLGVVVSFLASAVFARLGFGLALSFSTSSLLLGAVFSMAVGLVFGIAPAYRAAMLSPMDALRREF
jgi:putative ABC transport system permease protein